MKITAVRVFGVEGGMRSGEALYETERLGLAPYEATPYRATFTEIETDAGVTGLCRGGSQQVATLGRTLLGEDPLAIEGLWEKLMRTCGWSICGDLVLDCALWITGRCEKPVYRLGGPQPRVRLRG